jgi:hypothetical protein
MSLLVITKYEIGEGEILELVDLSQFLFFPFPLVLYLWALVSVSFEFEFGSKNLIILVVLICGYFDSTSTHSEN